MSQNMEAVYREWLQIVKTDESDGQGGKMHLISAGTQDEFSVPEVEVKIHLLEVAQADNELARPFHIERYVKMFELKQYPYPKVEEVKDESTSS